MKRLLLVLLAMISTAYAQEAEEETATILAYNVLIGFNSASKVQETAKWLRELDPDVILFQEIARQDSRGFANLARLWGHSYAAVAKPFTDYSIALTSKHPFEMVETRTADLHHGYVLARIHGVYFMSIHLSPFEYLRRIHETQVYVRRIKPLLDSGAKLVMMGDFNNFSPHDKEKFDTRLANMKPDARQRHVAAMKKNLNDGHYDYTAVQQLLDVGLFDAGFEYMNSHGIGYSWRIDLAMLSQNLRPDVAESYVEYPRASFFRQFSDHYPNILRLRNLHFPKAPAMLPPDEAVPPAAVPDSVNLVKNGTFDDGLNGWLHEIRTPELGSVEAVDGAAKVVRLPKSTFGRIYQDLIVEPGRYYTVTYRQRMDKGALAKALVISKGVDGQWREATRLNLEIPWKPSTWQYGKFTFKIADDVSLLRLDFRLDSVSMFELDDVVFRLATQGEITDLTPAEQRPEFRPAEGWRTVDGLVIRDQEVLPDTNMVLSLPLPALDKSASADVFFMTQEGVRIANSLITFNLQPSLRPRTLEAPILTPPGAAHLRVWLHK